MGWGKLGKNLLDKKRRRKEVGQAEPYERSSMTELAKREARAKKSEDEYEEINSATREKYKKPKKSSGFSKLFNMLKKDK